MRIQAAGLSITGKRETNQDALLVAPEQHLLAVADGMGGYHGGEIASRVALEALEGFLADVSTDVDRTWPSGWSARETLGQNLLAQAIEEAHLEVVRARTGPCSQMGTTMVALLLHDDTLVVGHVGDSRAYRLCAGAVELEALTEDDSLAAHWRKMGMLEPGEEAPPNMRHIVTAALGVGGFDRPTTSALHVQRGDRFMLCSDGLSGVLTDQAMAPLLAGSAPEDAANALVAAAYAAGSTDNITVVVADVV